MVRWHKYVYLSSVLTLTFYLPPRPALTSQTNPNLSHKARHVRA